MGKRKTVLVVDDSAVQLDELVTAFEDEGYEVGAASDGEAVLRRMAELEPDALLLDVYLPRLNGADVCRMVKSHPHWRRTHLVLMSARVSDEEAEALRRLGADALLRKPFPPAEAVAAVRAAIGAPGEE